MLFAMGGSVGRLGSIVSCAVVALACGASACGRSMLDDAVGGAAGNGAAGASNGTAGAGGGAGSGAAGAAFGCAPGSPDQTCNDDPSVNALWGMCLPAGGCECKDGFSYNPATGHCRPGSACVASGADPWVFTMALAHADCASRPATECEISYPSHQDTLNAAVLSLARSVCALPEGAHVRVVLTDGCPSLVEVNPLSKGAPLEPSLTACLVGLLAEERWACADATDCALVEWDLLP
jgi:hypothetical protein